MEDVADVNIGKVRENLSNWEDDNKPLAPLSSQDRDSIIELTSCAVWRPYPAGTEAPRRTSEVETGKSANTPTSATQHKLPDSLAALQLGEVKIESSQQYIW
ncbi:unnamed protein product, partial [Meganyctiphanes norvegica]